jgi:transcription elongation factor Elf1
MVEVKMVESKVVVQCKECYLRYELTQFPAFEEIDYYSKMLDLFSQDLKTNRAFSVATGEKNFSPTKVLSQEEFRKKSTEKPLDSVHNSEADLLDSHPKTELAQTKAHNEQIIEPKTFEPLKPKTEEINLQQTNPKSKNDQTIFRTGSGSTLDGSLLDVIVKLLDGNPLTLEQIICALKGMNGSDSLPLSVFYTAIYFSKTIKSIDLDGQDLFFVMGQEKLALDKANPNSMKQADDEILDLKQSNNLSASDNLSNSRPSENSNQENLEKVLPNKQRKTLEAMLPNVIVKLLDGNPMNLKQITERVKGFEGFGRIQRGLILTCLRSSELIKLTYSQGMELYYLEGQESIALGDA